MGITFLIVPRTGNVCFIGLLGLMPKKDENDSFNNKPL